MNKINLYFLPFLFLFILNSCVSNKRLTYFNGLKDSSFILAVTNFEPTIQKGDILYIGVTCSNPQEAAVFNSVNSVLSPSGITAMQVTTTPGQLISSDGKITLPQIGEIFAIGKTTKQLANEIQLAVTPYLKDPLVTIKFLNFKITVLGEVAKPGVINVSNERITILEALGQSGDLTPYANRENLLIIRDSAGFQQSHRFSLLDHSLFSKSFYFLKPNDVIYIEANNIKGINTGIIPTVLPLALSILSLFFLITNQIK